MKQVQIRRAYHSGLLQGKAYRVLQNHLTEALMPYQLSIPQWKLLGLLFDHEELKVAELAALMDVDPPLITKLVTQLMKKTFVKKKNDKTDKRVVYIIATAKGKKIIPDLEIVVRKALGELLIGVTAEDMKSYMKVLGIIVSQGKSLSVKKNYLVE